VSKNEAVKKEKKGTKLKKFLKAEENKKLDVKYNSTFISTGTS
jgi:hypothetical protein